MRSLFLPAVILVLSLDGLSLAQNEDSLVFRKDASVESGGLVADDTLAGAEPHFIVRIDRLVVDDMKLLDTLDVVVESFGNGFAGAVLKLGASSRFIEILEVLPGEICDSCRWEFFRAFEVNTADKPGFPSMLWQVTALAKMSPDSSRPFCYGFAGPGSLLRMVVSSEHVAQVPDTMASVFFFCL